MRGSVVSNQGAPASSSRTVTRRTASSVSPSQLDSAAGSLPGSSTNSSAVASAHQTAGLAAIRLKRRPARRARLHTALETCNAIAAPLRPFAQPTGAALGPRKHGCFVSPSRAARQPSRVRCERVYSAFLPIVGAALGMHGTPSARARTAVRSVRRWVCSSRLTDVSFRRVRDRRRPGRLDGRLSAHQAGHPDHGASRPIRTTSAASAAPPATRASCSTSAAIASSPSRRRWWTSGTRSCPTTSSAARACRASTTTASFFSYPLKAFEALTKLGPVESAMCVLSFMYKQAFPNEKPVTFHDWVTNQFGERLFSIFFKTYTEKVWGMSCDEISADWAAQRIKGLDLWTAMSHALRNSLLPAKKGPATKANGEVIKTLIDTFRYPRKGPGMMWDAAAAQGARARTARSTWARRSTACAGTSRRRLWTITARTAGRREPDLHGRATSSPRRRSASCWPACRPTPACKAAGRQAALPRLPHGGPDPREAGPVPRQLDLHPRAGVKVGRIQNFKSWSPEMVPDPNQSLPRPRVLLLRGRRPVERHRRRADRPGQEGAGADRPGRLERHHGRLRGAPEEGLSGLRRRLQSQRRDDPHRAGAEVSRRCTWSAATACTSTTTRTTP